MKPLDAITASDIRVLYAQAVSLRKVAHRLVAQARAMLQAADITPLDRERLDRELIAATTLVTALVHRFEERDTP